MPRMILRLKLLALLLPKIKRKFSLFLFICGLTPFVFLCGCDANDNSLFLSPYANDTTRELLEDSDINLTSSEADSSQKLIFQFANKESVLHKNAIQNTTLIAVAAFKSKIDNVKVKNTTEIFSKYKVITTKKIGAKLIEAGIAGSLFKISDDISAYLDQNRQFIALVNIASLDPFMRQIAVNDTYVTDENYPLFMKLILSATNLNSSNRKKLPNSFIFSKKEKNQLLTFTQTGVTALSRAAITQSKKEKDVLFLSRKISKFLSDSDITHTSNEVSFVPKCTYKKASMTFCTPPEYFEVLKVSGFDIIELTGNHNNDYGPKYNTQTIELYKKNNMRIFGGGRDLEEARKILYIKEKKNNIALLGYNFANVHFKFLHPLAKKNRAGANPYSKQQMIADIKTAKKKKSFVIVDFQFVECYSYKPGDNKDCYQPIREPNQQKVFRAAIDAGADMVVGTQAHQPQVIEVYKNKLIFYGLGNLYFDQRKWEGTRRGMILTHLFYKGEYKNTIVRPTYYKSNLQTYLVKGKLRSTLLDIYYQRK